jgi:Tfp pilus assembly protein PilV
MRHRLSSAQGFSLVEALVASVVLIAGVASTFQLFILATASTRMSGDMTRAAIAAARKAEELRASSFDDVSSGEDDADRLGVLRRQWSVQPFPEDPDGTAAITIVVERVGGGAAARATLALLRTRRAP